MGGWAAHRPMPLLAVRLNSVCNVEVSVRSGRFMTVRYNEKSGRNDMDQIFRVENMMEY